MGLTVSLGCRRGKLDVRLAYYILTFVPAVAKLPALEVVVYQFHNLGVGYPYIPYRRCLSLLVTTRHKAK